MTTRSPHTTNPLGVCREMGERGVALGSVTSRSSVDGYDLFCAGIDTVVAGYRPGAYYRDARPSTVRRDVIELHELLTAALIRMTDPSPRPVRRWPAGVEETSCGLCYGNAA